MFYYQRPTPQDVLFEEQGLYVPNSFRGDEINEWNVDGLTDRQISTMVHRMLMYCTICKAKPGNTDKGIAEMITVGFTGQLKARDPGLKSTLF